MLSIDPVSRSQRSQIRKGFGHHMKLDNTLLNLFMLNIILSVHLAVKITQ